MKIIIMGDTHGYLEKAALVIDKNRTASMVIHLGDFYRDAITLSSMFPGIPMEYVYGNSDIRVEGVCAEKVLEVSGKRIFVTHGHRYVIDLGYERLIKKAREIEADIVLFGHTHRAEKFKKKGILFLNPGSIGSLQDTYKCTYAVINIESKKWGIEILSFK